ncbi:MAG: DNA topoisomerase I [Deltaproteobacteria bacterium RBG_16_66_15]|nr:MAG: DNA topoisomerase I [Deltaproteobacteria bacterium RBG_16_66_15]
MARSLVVVESPAKAKTIQKILGKGFEVLSSMGHVKDLPKSRLGVDVENGFTPSYIVIKDRKKVLGEILNSARSAGTVFLAPDPDREGEAIAWHIADAIRADAGKKRNGTTGKRKTSSRGKKAASVSVKAEGAAPAIRRVLFHEITKKGITEGMEHPRPLDQHKFDAQQARRILDRIVGYTLSPLLWTKVRRGLSAGRVQSVAVKMICSREKEIAAFVPEEYWSLTARLEGKAPPPFPAKLVEAGGRKVRPRDAAETAVLRAAVENGPFVVREVRKKLRRRQAPAPFTTSKLQQEASKALRMQAYRTMMVAQSLYEGVEIPGAGLVGLITYMRTDSVRVADEAMAAVRDHIRKEYGEAYLPETPNAFRNRKSAQDAHEAIRPASLEHSPASLKGILNRDQLRLYELIWKRFVASQMAAAEFEQTAVDILCDPAGAPAGGYLFRAGGSVPKFPGFLEVYQAAVPESRGGDANGETADEENGAAGAEGERAEENVLPPLVEGEVLALRELVGNQHFTQPPPRFSESSLIKELEEQGIGRPSTYASIVKTIRERGYVKTDEGKFLPTELGTIVTGLLEESFPKVMDIAFTARMEEELDQIEDGDRELVQAMRDFYQPFSEELERAKIAMPTVKEELIATGIPCSACGGEMVIRFGRAGRFLACRNYPACRNTADFRQTPEGKVEILPPEETGAACEKCGKPMIVRNWKGARYIACSGYPGCRNSKPYPVGIACPECNAGEVVERSSRFGKIFYSCSRYPDCRFASWGRPIAQGCPVCGYPAMSERVRRDGSTQIVCLRKGCKGRAEEPVPTKKEEAG